MNCREFHTSITAAVDRYLSRDEMARFERHAGQCPACRAEYDNERMTKLVVQNRARMVPTPPALCRAILDRVLAEEPMADARSPWASVLRIPFLKPALVIGGAAVVLLLALLPPSAIRTTTTQPVLKADVVSQSLANYRAFVAGLMTPQMVSDRPESVQAFLNGQTEFPVMVPSLHECTLVGGVVTEYAGTPQAHVMYRRGETVVYVYQACWETVQRGESLQLPDAVRKQLLAQEMVLEEQPDGCTVALWTEGRTLCAAVASMSGTDLLACLGQTRAPSRLVRPR